MDSRPDAWQVLLACFTISSLGGLAQLLRSGRAVTRRMLLAAMLYSGLMGLVIGLIWYNYFNGQDNLYFLVGVSGLAGLGGTTLLDFLLQVVAQGGIHVTIQPKRRESDGDSDRATRNGVSE